MTNAEQRRLRRSVALHVFAVAVFAMLALSGAGAATQRAFGLAVPFIVAGLAGAVGAALIAAAVWRSRRGEPVPGDTATHRNGAPQRTVRLAMAAAAVVVLAAGVLLAPGGMDRGFVISVAAFLAVTLALFALLAGDRPRIAEPPGSALDPH